MVKLVPRGKRDDDPRRDRAASASELHSRVPEARFEYVQVLQDVLADLAGNPSPIEIKLLGDDPRRARGVRRGRPASGSSKLDELVDVFDGREGETPILRSRIEPLQLARLGLDADDVGADLDDRARRPRGRADPAARAHDRRSAALPRRDPLRTPARSRAR